MTMNKNQIAKSEQPIPNFFLIGASKTGTTTLWSVLKEHPDIYLSDIKEPSYFAMKNYTDKESWYLSLFNAINDEKIIGDISPIYSETLIIKEIPQRIYSFNKNSMIIYIVREPIDRMLSLWKQNFSSGHWYRKVYDERFGHNIGTMPKEFIDAIWRYPPFIESCKYWETIKAYRKYFRDDQLLVLYYDELVKYPQKFFERLLNFLKVKQTPFPNIRKNIGSNKRAFRPYYLHLNERKKLIIKSVLPQYIFNRLAKKKVIPPNLSENQINDIRKYLKDDTEKLLEYCQKPLDYWF